MDRRRSGRNTLLPFRNFLWIAPKVTNAEYAEFVRDTNYEALSRFGSEESHWLVRTVADCECIGKRWLKPSLPGGRNGWRGLPSATEDEWEFAARTAVSTGLSPGKHLGTERAV